MKVKKENKKKRKIKVMQNQNKKMKEAPKKNQKINFYFLPPTKYLNQIY
jgi:hypothetical protein